MGGQCTATAAAKAVGHSSCGGGNRREPAWILGFRPKRTNLPKKYDYPDAAQSLAEMLRWMGHEVGTAGSGETALACWQRESPDVLVPDIGLPDMSGHEVARRIRALQDGAAPPMLVALTGWGQPADRQHAEQAGFDHHLTKPADPALLLRLLDATRARPHRVLPAATREPRQSADPHRQG